MSALFAIASHLSPARTAELQQVCALAAARHWPLYVVGGFVRDVSLGLAPDDFDLVVAGHAPTLARAACDTLGGTVQIHAPFGTATWLAPSGWEVDFASARTETYTQPAALPTVQFPTTIDDDLRRRDFTLNAMAVRLDGDPFGELLDPFGGQADLAARRLRVLHPLSFVDDPTRLFRAARYAARYGLTLTDPLPPQVWAALAALSPDRARHELELIFREPHAAEALMFLQRRDVLAHLHPAFQWTAFAHARARELETLPWAAWRLTAPPPPEALYLALLLTQAPTAESVQQALRRLNPQRALTEAVQDALALPSTWLLPSKAVAALDAVSELAVIAAYAVQGAPMVHEYLAHWRFVRATLTGDDLRARGLPPGPDYKRLLWQLRAGRLDGFIHTDAEEHEWLNQML